MSKKCQFKMINERRPKCQLNEATCVPQKCQPNKNQMNVTNFTCYNFKSIFWNRLMFVKIGQL